MVAPQDVYLTGREADDAALVAALRRGDEAAFVALVDRYHWALVRLAACFVPNHDVAEEVAQETWQAVLQGLAGFEGRSSLRTWIFRILSNRARSRGVREGRSLPFSALAADGEETDEPAVAPERFRTSAPWPGHWVSFPSSWDDVPEERLLSRETRDQLQTAIGSLPATQRQVIVLRDVEGLSAEDVCAMLALSESNQRVLLHRARSRVRRHLAEYLGRE